MTAIQTLLLQIAVILLLARVMHFVMRRIGQPGVVGEMIAGIALGPSVLGLIRHGQWMDWLFPRTSLTSLDLLSQLGVMLYMFLVGLELEPRLLRGQTRLVLLAGGTGILVPFIAGAILGLGLLHSQAAGNVASPLMLCAFLGTAMSITAFPVLARILHEHQLQKSPVGTLAITCAALNDVCGWCILALVMALARMEGYGGGVAVQKNPLAAALLSFLLMLLCAPVILFLLRALLRRLQDRFDRRQFLTQSTLAAVLLLLVLSACVTESIGIHQAIGSFLLGAIAPKNPRFIAQLTEKLQDFTVVLLLPLFFALTGLRTQIGLLGSSGQWTLCLLVVLIATAAKASSVCLAARWGGLGWRPSALLGALMNTRGLMELIVLNIGLTLGILSPTLFTIMVVMALATTLMTAPLIHLLHRPDIPTTDN